MNKKKPIVLIENNEEDRKIFMQIFSELEVPNEVLYFNTANDAYFYLTSKKIKALLILSDIALLNMSDKQNIESTYKNLSAELHCPCLFFALNFNQSFVIDLYSYPPQSYVIKPYDYDKFKKIVYDVLKYWSKVKSIKDYKSDPIGRNNIGNNLN